ncbi:MAG: bifunctional diguanylate cyclase/phosphodiesterase [Burkholderiales bacterium]|nr:MAG: bifunctional diguanylate cyclase/phosphodiesterase [Burkholderiales bacterium]
MHKLRAMQPERIDAWTHGCIARQTRHNVDNMTPPADFASLFEQLPLGAYRSSIDGKPLRANAALVALNGYASEAEMLAIVNDIGTESYVDPARREEFLRLIARDRQVVRFVSEIYRHKTRERIWISEYAHVVVDDSGAPIYIEGTIEDITERRLAREQISASERRLRVLTEKSQSVTLICTVEGVILYATPSIERLLGCSAESVLGASLFDSMHEDDCAEHRLEFHSVSTGNNTGAESIARHRHADGSWRYLASFASDCRNDPAVGGMVVYWRDVTESQRASVSLKRVAQTDALTGLVNRSHFERLARAMLDVARVESACVALYFIDLDKFKWVNDSYGHLIGDQVLVETVNRLERALTADHLLARLGGDEFAVIAPVDLLASVEETAMRWVNALTEPIVVNDMSFHVSASVGVSVFPDDADSFETLLQHADHAMFAAKADRDHSFRRFEPEFSTQALSHARLATELYRAVKSKQFLLYFQPQIDSVTGRTVGLEALARWEHPTRGMVAPAEFIRVAEDQGLISELGDFLLDQALFAAALLRDRCSLVDGFRIAVNTSAHQLSHPSFVDRVMRALAKHELPASVLQIEVTESAFIEQAGRAQHAMAALRTAGISVALDDLGVGYSSLDYLRRLTIDAIKLDRDFVSGLPHKRVECAVVRSILLLAGELGIQVIAEGVETSEQAQWLVAHGCQTLQGYFLAVPAALDVTTEALRAEGIAALPKTANH